MELNSIQRALEIVARRKITQRQHYMRKRGITDDIPDEVKALEAANKQMISYEKQKARQRQQRLDRGLKPKGRPFKTKESELMLVNLMQQLGSINNIVLMASMD
jgi:hypothetical protein